jgi:hypothetical protein
MERDVLKRSVALNSVLDVASRRVLGFTLAERHDAQMAYGALAARGGRVRG